jgi:hypothetical protein
MNTLETYIGMLVMAYLMILIGSYGTVWLWERLGDLLFGSYELFLKAKAWLKK